MNCEREHLLYSRIKYANFWHIRVFLKKIVKKLKKKIKNWQLIKWEGYQYNNPASLFQEIPNNYLVFNMSVKLMKIWKNREKHPNKNL